MKTNRLILSMIAMAAIVAGCNEEEDFELPAINVSETALTFTQDGGAINAQSLYVTSTRDWTATCDDDWVVISPISGKHSSDAVEVTVYVDANTSTDRTTTITFNASDMVYSYVTVTQAGPGGSIENTYVYSNDFDGSAATQTYGSSSSSWPYLDQFDGWQNETGTGISTVSYNYANMSVRDNSNSNGSYSLYDGSGTNNLFFGSTTNYFVIQNITLPTGQLNYSLSFGSEQYVYDADDNTFDHSQFHVYISDNGEKWVELSYAFPNGDQDGTWDIASTTFTLPSGTSSLYIYYTADLASTFRLDDVLLATISEAGTAINFSTGIEGLPGSGEGSGGGGGDDGDYIYHNDFDKTAATQTYGSGSSWPYLDQFDGWQNETGSGVSTVSYNYANASARNNSNSNGSYSNYDGSGTNNIFFGSVTNYFVIQNITLPSGTTNYTLTFGGEKYLSGGSSTFDHSEYHLYLSQDGLKWTEISYAFDNGDPDATWDLANTTFTLPSGTTSLYIYFTSDVASAYRLDDVSLTASSTSGTSVNFSNGVELPGGGEGNGGGGGGDNGDLTGDGTANNPYTVADAVSICNAGTYSDDNVYIEGIIYKIAEIDTGSYGNATYYISDDGTAGDSDADNVEVYRGYSLNGAKFTSSTEIEVGDKVVVCGQLTMWYEQPEVTTGSSIYSIEKGNGGGGGGDDGEEGDLVYGNDFDKEVVSSNTTITSTTTCYQNETGSGIANVSYNWSAKMSVRKSNASSGYTGVSGNNNIFFSTDDPGYFVIKNIALPSGETNYKLAFGARDDNQTFEHSGFKVYISQDNKAWVELSYTFENGDQSKTWDIANTYFTVPSGTSTLYIYYSSEIQSEFRIDDVRFTTYSEAGTSIDFSKGITLVGGGSDDEGYTLTGDGTVNNPYTVADANNLVNYGDYTSDKVYIKGIVSGIKKYYDSYQDLDYYISDDGSTTDQLLVYGGYGLGGEKITSEDYLKTGDVVVVYGALTSYYNTPEVNSGNYIYSLNGKTADDNGGGSTSTITWENVGSSYQTWSETTDSTYGDGYTATQDGMTVSYYQYEATSAPTAPQAAHIRVYKSSELVISVSGAKAITSVTLTATGTSYALDMPVSDGTTAKGDTSALTITWTGSIDVFKAQASNGQVRIEKIVVEYE